MIVVYQKPTKADLSAAVTEMVERATNFLMMEDPVRDDVKVKAFFGNVVTLRRRHIQEDADAYAKTVETAD
jgi:hypothetical protein